MNAQRPCPWVSCKYHLYLEVKPSGNLTVFHPDTEVHDMPVSCVLDVADRKGQTLEEVGAILGVTRERVRQIETAGQRKAEADIQLQAHAYEAEG